MSVASYPDIFSMLVLMAVLVWLKRQHTDRSVGIWVVGLCFILLETVSVSIYRSGPVLHRTVHALALDSYSLAGVAFGWASRRRRRFPLFLLPALPLLAICTMYGAEIKVEWVYQALCGVSAVSAVGYAVWMAVQRRRYPLGPVSVFAAIWLVLLLLSVDASPRTLVYTGLCCEYLLVAASFRRRLRRGQIGGVLIMVGFVLWALCFLTHPFVTVHLVWEGLNDQVWSLQKFSVIIGMLIVLLEDATERNKSLALHDALTGLPNRRLFEDRLEQGIHQAERVGGSMALFVLDLDGFKEVNDTMGHPAGDTVLQQTAIMLRARVRSADTLARCGGDEFSVVVGAVTSRGACERVASQLREAVEQVSPDGYGLRLSASVGFALYPEDAGDAEALRRCADERMYAQKRQHQAGGPGGEVPLRQRELSRPLTAMG